MPNLTGARPRAATDWRPILTRLQGTLNSVADLRRELGLLGNGAGAGLSRGMHDAFVDYSLSALSRFHEVILRPIAEDAEWVDMPTGQSFKVGQAMRRANRQNWLEAFPDFEEQVVNVIGNEDYLVIERHASGTHEGPLRSASRDIPPSRRRFDIDAADVVRIENGRATRIDHYYDMASVLRRLGMMPNIALGHDERDATPLPVLHASGFLRWTPEVRSPARWPVSIGRSVSVGHGQSEMARANMANCVAIHEAFIQHTPERFADLIAEDAIWVDVPTGEVLNGAAAAAHHDHGNWMTAFPDSSAEITNLTGNEDWVAVQHRGFGTHLGELRLGGQVYQPTGRPVEIRVLDLVQYRGGRAVLIRNYYDMAVMLTQLGVIPT